VASRYKTNAWLHRRAGGRTNYLRPWAHGEGGAGGGVWIADRGLRIAEPVKRDAGWKRPNPGKSNQIQPFLVQCGLLAKGRGWREARTGLRWRGPNPGKSGQIQPILARRGLMAEGTRLAGNADGRGWREPNPGKSDQIRPIFVKRGFIWRREARVAGGAGGLK